MYEIGALVALTTLSAFIIRFVIKRVWDSFDLAAAVAADAAKSAASDATAQQAQVMLLVTNHIEHNTAALTELITVIRALREDKRV